MQTVYYLLKNECALLAYYFFPLLTQHNCFYIFHPSHFVLQVTASLPQRYDASASNHIAVNMYL
jgi:hypothetical protein